MSRLAIDRLSVRYGGTAVLHEVSLAVGAGEIVALVGASGSGKSTLARAALGLLPPGATTDGDVTLDGRPIAPADRGRRVALLLQDPATALNPARTIGSQIGELLPRAERPAAVAAALARVGLEVEPGRYPHALSGGQRARAALAAALASGPDILLADEPTAALDPAARAAMARLFRALAGDGLGLLLVTHDLALAMEVADRVAVLEGGRIVEAGDHRILARPASAALAALRAAADLPPPPPHAPGAPLLAMTGVTRRYRSGWRGPAVTGIVDATLHVRAGETLALIGPSGAGKSTLARLALGLDRPDAGEVRLGTHDPARARGRERQAVRRLAQAVFQDPATSFDPRWSVGAIVGEPLRLLGLPEGDDELVAAALAAVELDPAWAARRPATLSGGQRQRVALARALVIEPRLIVLDEALSALDLATRASIVRLLHRLQQERGLAYLLIAHDMDVVAALAHRVARVEAGRIVAEGPAAAMLG